MIRFWYAKRTCSKRWECIYWRGEFSVNNSYAFGMCFVQYVYRIGLTIFPIIVFVVCSRSVFTVRTKQCINTSVSQIISIRTVFGVHSIYCTLYGCRQRRWEDIHNSHEFQKWSALFVFSRMENVYILFDVHTICNFDVCLIFVNRILNCSANTNVDVIELWMLKLLQWKFTSVVTTNQLPGRKKKRELYSIVEYRVISHSGFEKYFNAVNYGKSEIDIAFRVHKLIKFKVT